MSTLKVDTILKRTGTGTITLGQSGDTIDIPTGAGLTVTDEVKTNKISPGSGTAFTFGDSGDTFTIPSGATIANSGTATGFGGITAASQWRLTTTFTGDAEPIASNLEQVDAPVGYGVLGSSMTESSGIFTFPSTGYWLIEARFVHYYGGDSDYANGYLYTTTNDSTYALAAQTSQSLSAASGGVSTPYADASFQYIIDVTDTSQVKCRFDSVVEDNSVSTQGNTSQNATCFTFIRLGDT